MTSPTSSPKEDSRGASGELNRHAKTQGKKRLSKEEYGKGPGEDKRPLLERLVEETGGRCVYCSNKITKDNAHKDP